MAEEKTKTLLYSFGAIASIVALYLVFRNHPALNGPPSDFSGGADLSGQTPPQMGPGSVDIGGSPVSIEYNLGGGGNGDAAPLEMISPITPVVQQTPTSQSGETSKGGCGCCGETMPYSATAQNLINEWSPSARDVAVVNIETAAPPTPPKFWQGFWTDEFGTNHYAPGYSAAVAAGGFSTVSKYA